MKTTILSTRKVNTYKIIVFAVWLLLLALLVFISFDIEEELGFTHLRWGLYWGIGFYFFYIKKTLKLQNIAYDHGNIYIVKGNQEIIIPFLEVKDIRLENVTGVHSILLYRDLGLGEKIYFKSSLWYPFNFKKVDEEVYQLQLKIDKAKQNTEIEPSTKSLSSYSV